MYNLKILKIFVFSLILFSVSKATEIYYVNISNTLEKSKIKEVAVNTLKKDIDKLAKKYRIDELKGKKQLSKEELERYKSFINQVNMYQGKITNNVLNLLLKLTDKFAKKKGYKVIVSETSVVYSKPKYDKTEEFIKFVNAEISKNKTKIINELGSLK